MEMIRDEETGEKYIRLQESGKKMEIPGCFMYSRGGFVPHLTDDNLKRIIGSELFCHLPLSTIYEQPGVEVMEKFGGSFHEFSSSQDKVWVLNTNDSLVSKPDSYKYNEAKSISIWAPSGRRKITPEEYMKVLQIFSFDVAIPPSDSIPEGLTKKRCRKSAERTAEFLSSCLQIKREKELNVPVCGVIEGGDSEFFREKSAKDISGKNVDAYVLGGFDLLQSNWKELLQLCTKHLMADKAKMMFGVLTPIEVLDAVQLNVDIFDTIIAYYAAERGCALNFSYYRRSKINSHGNISNGNTAKRVKVEKEGNFRKDLSKYEMDLNDKKYFNDDKPLVDGCQCYCCLHHVRAYIHHLLITKEMLAPVLLMMHNLTYWLEFFKEIRKCVQQKRLDELKEILLENS